jgi:ornithine--oxo-acid transaminase
MDRSVVHSSTFGGNIMAMAAALVTLKLIDDEDLIENAYNMGELFLKELSPLESKHELIKDIRGMGLMLAIEFGNPKSLKMKTAWKFIEGANKGVFSQMVLMPLLGKYNILSQVAGHEMNVIKLLPPLTITKKEIDYFVMALDSVLSECHKFPGALWDFATTLMKHYIKDDNKS